MSSLRAVLLFALVALCGCGRVGYDPTIVTRDAAVGPAPADARDVLPGDGPPVGTDLPAPARPTTFAVGSFSRGGVAAGVTQRIPHGLDGMPKALLLWTSGAPAGASRRSAAFAVGASDGPAGTSRSASLAIRDGVNPTVCHRRLGSTVFVALAPDGRVLAEAVLQAWDASSFTLFWNVADGADASVHFLIAGGQTEAKVVEWTTRVAPGRQVVTGVGFRADLVLHVYMGAGFDVATPATLNHAGMGVGAMNAAGQQWSNLTLGSDGAPASVVDRAQRTDAAVFMFSPPNVTKQATFAAMNDDGFALDFSVANPQTTRLFSVALKGVRASVGNVAKTGTSAPTLQAVRGIGFAPEVVLVSSAGAAPSTTWVSDGLVALGAAAGPGAAAAAFFERSRAPVSASWSLARTDRVVVIPDATDVTSRAEARLAPHPDGFDLEWLINDGTPAQLGYVALRAL